MLNHWLDVCVPVVLPPMSAQSAAGVLPLYRVTVGPDVSQVCMDALVPKVSQIAGTSAKVIAYAPLG